MITQQQTGAVVEARELVKTFRDFWRRPQARAVRDVTFDVGAGEVFGLLGPNGSGKSTTLKMILGLLHPTSGRLHVLGHSPRDVATKNRVGYLPEETYIYPYLTPDETLSFYGRLFNLPRPVRRERTEQLLDMIGLVHARKRCVGEFSKGMARRIGLAQALINDPDLIVLDEPTSGLDPQGCRQIKDLILTLAKRGKTILLSSHLLADVEDVCDRIAILYGGQIRAQGPIRRLLEEKDRYRITFADGPQVDMKKILSAVRDIIGRDPDVDHPQRNLEQYFLEIVESARRETPESSGASAGGPVADYLSEAEHPS